MKLSIAFGAAAVALIGAYQFYAVEWDLPPVEVAQTGFRGTGMQVVYDAEDVAEQVASPLNDVPEQPWEALPAEPGEELAGEIYQNVQVLYDVSDDQFNHFMSAITEWVSPEQGCNYCHNALNYASDEVYTKVVSRRMIQMNQETNVEWANHVGGGATAQTVGGTLGTIDGGGAGVTCYTCHRGNNIPLNYWSIDASYPSSPGMLGYRAGQNVATVDTGSTSLPQNAIAAFLYYGRNANVHSETALPAPGQYENGTRPSIQDAEWTWSFMIHMSESLGVNCTFCHNSRAFNDWSESPPTRVTAWYGIRMARDLNNEHMEVLNPVFPSYRKGEAGDVFKVGCSTCHYGAQQPLYGANMLKDYLYALGEVTLEADYPYEEYLPGVPQYFTPDGPIYLDENEEPLPPGSPAPPVRPAETASMAPVADEATDVAAVPSAGLVVAATVPVREPEVAAQ